MKKQVIIFITIVFPSFFAYGIELDPIIVTKEQGRLGTYRLSAQEIRFGSYDSLESIPQSVSSVNVMARGDHGVQQDLSIRGALFEDTSVLLEGVKMNDPQTGHFSQEIPFTLFDIGEVEIIPYRQTVQYFVKSPQEEGVRVASIFGEHAFFHNAMSMNFRVNNSLNRVSADVKKSSGARQDRDFRIYTVTGTSLWEDAGVRVQSTLGFTQRDFGAGTFYSSLFPQEEEHTDQRFALIDSAFPFSWGDFVNKVYYRRHEDKFMLARHTPSFFMNDHTSYRYGVDLGAHFSNALRVGAVYNQEKITSTNLGGNVRDQFEVYWNGEYNPAPSWSTHYAVRESNYDRFGWLNSFDLHAEYLFRDDVSALFAFSSSWRVPSFTELYYNSPSNRGNSALEVQRTFNGEAGIEKKFDEKISVYGGLFAKRQFDTIDWVRDSASDPWQAMNIGTFEGIGVEGSFMISNFSGFLDSLAVHYTYLDINRDNPFTFSKYLFQFLRHKVTMRLEGHFLGNRFVLSGHFDNPNARAYYSVWKIEIRRPVNVYCDVFMSIDNVFNSYVEYVQDVSAPGRWGKIGIELKF